MKEVKNDLTNVRFYLYRLDGMRFDELTIQQLNEWANRSYRKDGNKRKPTTLLKENGWQVNTRIWDETTERFEPRPKSC